MSDKVDTAIEVVNKGIDVFQKLLASFTISKETKELTRKSQEEINQLKFTKFNETSSCNSVKGIPKGKFENFVERFKKRYGLPDEVKDSILDAPYSLENEESVKEFKFRDGQGDVYHGRFVTITSDEMIDIAYAIYSLSFQLSKESRRLSDKEMDKFTKWCLVKLYDRVQEECGSQFNKV